MAVLLCAAETPPLPNSEPAAGAISIENLRQHIAYLASPKLEGRGGPPGKQLAAAYIEQHYREFGLQPLFAEGSYFQDVPGMRTEEGEPTVVGRNIGAWLPGSDPKLRDEIVILSAHYDHLGKRNGVIYPGADDNASSVAMVLEVARQFAAAKVPPRRSLAFVNFDLEEHFLWGSQWFAAHPPWPIKQVKLFITADLLGRSLGDLPLPSVFVLGSEHAQALRDVLAEVPVPEGLELARLGIDMVGTRSDYGPFRDRKIPFLFFSTGEHPDYHTPRDVPERIDYPKLQRISTVIEEVCESVANSDTAPVWTNAVEPDLGEVKTLNHITELLLKVADERKFSDLQRLLITQVNTKTRQIAARGQVTPEERKWLVRSAQLLLFSVF